MKVVILSSAESAYEPRLYYKIARMLASTGNEVVIIAQHRENTVQGNICIRGLPAPRSRVGRMVGTTLRVFVRALRENGDIYRISDPELIPLGLLLQFLSRRPVVFDLREYHAERIRDKFWIPRWMRGVAAASYEWLERICLRHFAGIITVNEDLARRLRARGCQRVIVIPNYPPLSLFPRGAINNNMELKTQYERNRVVIHVGGMSRDRGITQAIQAMAIVRKHIPNAKLLLLGRFHQLEFEQEVRNIVRELSLEENVEILGPVLHHEVPSYLRVAEVGLVLLQPIKRHEKAEPIKYFEYSAMGIPQVVSDLPALRSLVERVGNGLLVDPVNVNDIAEAIIRLLEDTALAREMGERGRSAIEKEYNWENVGLNLHNFLVELVEK